jgi:hypothetical protein
MTVIVVAVGIVAVVVEDGLLQQTKLLKRFAFASRGFETLELNPSSLLTRPWWMRSQLLFYMYHRQSTTHNMNNLTFFLGLIFTPRLTYHWPMQCHLRSCCLL